MSEPKYRDEEWLREQYMEKGLSSPEIANICGVSDTTILRWLNNYDVQIKRKHGRDLSEENPLRNPEWLNNQYWKEEKTAKEIADEAGVSATTVLRRLKKYGLGTRSQSYNTPTGQNSPHWTGGDFGEYGKGWNKTKRRKVRERDGQRCQDCGVTQSNHIQSHGEKLHVHHLIKARDIDDPEKRNAMENLITLCRDCHREWERVSEAGIRPQIDDT